MRTPSLVALLAGLLGALSVGMALPEAQGEDARPSEGVTWHRDLAAATELAARRGRPLCVVFR